MRTKTEEKTGVWGKGRGARWSGGPGISGPRTEGIVKLKHWGCGAGDCGAGGSRGAGPSRCEPITEGIVNLEKNGGCVAEGGSGVPGRCEPRTEGIVLWPLSNPN